MTVSKSLVQPQVALAERLERYSIPEPNTGCQLWLGHLQPNGYPQISVDGVTRRAHRVVLERKIGRPLLPHEFACHKCDVKICIAEDHLFVGTHDKNMADMVAKGRQAHGERAARGERSGAAKLTEQQVLAIRADDRSHLAIARAFGVARTTISDIKRGARWAHLGELP